MRILGLDNKEYPWNPGAVQHAKSKVSDLHSKARALLERLFPYDRILEECTLPGTKTMVRKSLLTADFFVPNRNLIIEVNGQQHFEQNSHFHNNAHDFYKGVARDKDKARWCEINSFTLVNLNWDESIEEWETKING